MKGAIKTRNTVFLQVKLNHNFIWTLQHMYKWHYLRNQE